MSEHTPTPWRKVLGYADCMLKGSRGEEIGWLNPQMPIDESVANAEHIVRCVNAHDALVDALEGAIEMGLEFSTGFEIPEEEFNAMKIALKLAKGGE